MEAPHDPGSLGVSYKQPYLRIFHRKDLHWQTEKCLCAGAELLLLPGCGGGMPDRLVSGSGRLVKIQIFLLYYRHPDFIGGAAGTVHLRFSLPVWLAAGAFA